MEALQAARQSAISQLSAGVAHQINNPLTVIQGSVDQLLSQIQAGTLTPERCEQLSGRLSRAVARISETVDALRQVDESAGMIEECVPLDRLVDQTLDLLDHRFERSMVQLRRPERKTSGVHVRARGHLMRQVLLHLISNALDALENHDGERWVELDASGEGEFVVFRVTDSGPGIPPEHEPYIFEPFFTTKEGAAGRGLGLSFGRSVAQSHGGSLDLDRGSPLTSFVLTLPSFK